MAVLKKYKLDGSEVEQVEIEEALLDSAANSQMIKDYLVALRANARQWSAHTKTRAEVNHSGKKPHPQKGTGRARQGFLGATHYKGGGRVHAPRSKFDQHVRINRKERRAAVRHLLIEKIRGNHIHVLHFGRMQGPKTQTVAKFLEALALQGKRVLFLGEGFATHQEATKSMDHFRLSMRNIPKTQFSSMPTVSGYDVILHTDLVVMENAVDQLKVLLGGQE